MAASTKRARESAKRASDAAASLRSNAYVQRLIEDDELRANIREAFESARDAYTRIANGKGPAKALMEDKKVQRDLRKAAESMRGVRAAPRAPQATQAHIQPARAARADRRRAGPDVKREDLRKAVLDKMFGAEEEFEYTSTTSPAPETASTQS